jgi:2-C-methyl-D-erythritol 2,4-cyclodiphosphate synthase
VLSHAVCDAVLGALGQPDMGRRFPDDDPRHAGRSSLAFLREVAAEMRKSGMALVNLDAVLLAEAPRLQPHLEAMRVRIAAALRTDPGRIGIKVKRGEGLGTVGRREGMIAQAVVLLERSGGAVPRRPVRVRPGRPRPRRPRARGAGG